MVGRVGRSCIRTTLRIALPKGYTATTRMKRLVKKAPRFVVTEARKGGSQPLITNNTSFLKPHHYLCCY